MKTRTTDRIERSITLKAPRERVWRALTDHREFGAWFGVEMAGPFAAGTTVNGRVLDPNYSQYAMMIRIQRMEPMHYFSWRWHPAALNPVSDYANEPTTLVEFTLEEVAGGTRLTTVESGFDALPDARRTLCLRLNTEGWDEQIANIQRHVDANG